jgi:hypothetical protein
MPALPPVPPLVVPPLLDVPALVLDVPALVLDVPAVTLAVPPVPTLEVPALLVPALELLVAPATGAPDLVFSASALQAKTEAPHKTTNDMLEERM